MKKINIIAMLWAVSIMVFGTFSAASAAGQPETMSLVVKLANGLAAVEQAAVIARNGGVETSTIPALRLHVITVPAVDLPLILQNYQSDAQVESVELNKTRKAEAIPTDINYGVQWSLSKIGWESVFGTVTPSGSAKVAILDTGVDATHPDLTGNIIPGTSILDGSNGLSDPSGHGTSMAGIVAALTNNGKGIAGVGYPGVRIMPVTVLGQTAPARTATSSRVSSGRPTMARTLFSWRSVTPISASTSRMPSTTPGQKGRYSWPRPATTE